MKEYRSTSKREHMKRGVEGKGLHDSLKMMSAVLVRKAKQ
jgi:hypothetical protein